MPGRVVDAMGVPIDGREALSDHEQRRVEVKAPGILERKSVHEKKHELSLGPFKPQLNLIKPN
ncbi:hypothetical protein Bca4012_044832 [Brassica carinata]|uniref:(rape) hypothetical protein n=1 Tax=Brassica napus TaxID=3708 RepID=A0A078I8E3_BRANA|nr:unnamed protein product [Brassica napus]CDY45669.1 BnaC09g32110D [Brassica napus]